MYHNVQPFTVRIIYVLPNDAEPWREVKHRAKDVLKDIQWYFSDEMDRCGYGPKTFRIATDNQGEIIFHQVKSSLSKNDFLIKHWDNCKKAASTLRNKNDVVVYFFESYKIFDSEKVKAGARGIKNR